MVKCNNILRTLNGKLYLYIFKGTFKLPGPRKFKDKSKRLKKKRCELFKILKRKPKKIYELTNINPSSCGLKVAKEPGVYQIEFKSNTTIGGDNNDKEA